MSEPYTLYHGLRYKGLETSVLSVATNVCTNVCSGSRHEETQSLQRPLNKTWTEMQNVKPNKTIGSVENIRYPV